jgi:hypothetical protein
MDSFRIKRNIPDKTKEIRPKTSERPSTSLLTTEQRIHALANIIVDRILENHKLGTLELSS